MHSFEPRARTTSRASTPSSRASNARAPGVPFASTRGTRGDTSRRITRRRWGTWRCWRRRRRRGADADAEDAEGKTALHHAVANGRDACARYLVDSCDAWVDASDGRDETPLLAACRQGDASTVETLLARGADAAARNVDGCDAFTEALCVRGDVVMARLLVAAGVNPKRSRTRCGKSGASASRSPLNVACGMGRVDAVRFLVDECGFDASGTECGGIRITSRRSWRLR